MLEISDLLEEELYYPSGEYKGADQLRSNRFHIGQDPVFS